MCSSDLADSFSGSLTRDAGEHVASGPYNITQGTLDLGTDYNITYVGDTFAITAKPITVTADPGQSKVYGETDPVLTYTTNVALVGGDSFTGSLTRDAGEHVASGPYNITQGTLDLGTDYNITYVGDTFAITAKPITVTVDQIGRAHV